jgi:hypothetical protein
MSRGMTSAAVAAVQQETVIRTVAVDLDFASGVVRLNGSPVTLQVGGHDYLGVGALGSVSGVEEAIELKAYGLQLTLAGIPRDAVALALTEVYRNRRAQVWELVLDPATWLPVSDPVLMFRGRMDQMTINMGTTATLVVQVESRMRDWERASGVLATYEEQHRRSASDTFFAFVADAAEKSIVWPQASFWK